jgi:hypothetical protein
MSFCLAQSGQIMSSASVIKPRPTSEVLQVPHVKQSLCQCRSSNEMNLVPPIPTQVNHDFCLKRTEIRLSISHTFKVKDNFLTCDWFGAGEASLSEEIAVAVGAIGLVVLGGKSLTSQRICAVGAGETLSVPGLVLVRHSSTRDDFLTLDAPCGKLLFVAPSAVNFLLAGDEALRPDRVLANAASKALLVPLSRLVLHLLCTWISKINSYFSYSSVHMFTLFSSRYY